MEFLARWWWVGVDGERFLMIRSVSEVEPEMFLVKNFSESLRERMGN